MSNPMRGLVVAAVLLLGTSVRADPDPAGQARAVVDQWLTAQNTGTFADYDKLYAKRFRGIRRSGAKTVALERADWMRERAKMFKTPMTVSIDQLVVDATGNRARVRFVQRFASGTYKDVGDKELVIVGALIVREEMLTSSKGGADGSVCEAYRCKDTSNPAAIVATCDRACAANDARACHERAVMADSGWCGASRDHAMAIALYTKACGPDQPMDCTTLAIEKEKTDPAAALAFYRKGCDADEPYACTQVARALMTKDPAQAITILAHVCDEYPRSAPGGGACRELWERYRDGKAVKRDKAKADEFKLKYDNAMGGE
jgi:hypothetical protein